jgi:serine/threonine protein kinase
MGVVYEAEDPHLHRRVAIKIVRPDQLDHDARARLLREARALARISHPNVVAVHDVGEHDGQVFVATELVEGETMSTWQRGRDWRAVIAAWIQVARGLAAVHAGGIVHRDVKPSNVFVGRDGRVRVGDFGIARDVVGSPTERTPRPGSHTLASLIAGTPGYMAPEQLHGIVDARSDQFALCAVRDVLLRGLEIEPSGRYETMTALVDALDQAVDAVPPTVVRSRSWIGISLTVAGLGVAVLLILLMARSVTPRTASVPGVDDPVAGRAVPAPQPAPEPARSASPDRAAPDRATGAVPPPPDQAPSSPDTSTPPAARDNGSGSSSPPSDRPSVDHKPAGARPTAINHPAAPKSLDSASVDQLVRDAHSFEKAGEWKQARAVYSKLEHVKGYSLGEALYRQAYAAFQSHDFDAARQLTVNAGRQPGPYKTVAMLLYGDVFYVEREFERAKEIYNILRKTLVGSDRATAIRKIAACNKELGLPENDGVTD